MRVMLDTTYAARAPYSGTAIYLEALQKALSEVDGVELVQVANVRRGLPAGGGLGSARNLLIDRWWGAVELPRLAAQARAEVIHHPLPASASSRIPQVVTVHDLAFERLPEQFDRGFRIYARLNHRAAALAAGAVICVSQSTASDVRDIWGVPAERIVVARHGPGQEPMRLLGDRPVGEAEHFLYVGDDEPRKNLSTLLAAYRGYAERVSEPLELLLAGAAARGVPGVRSERHPPPGRLAELYARAAALIQPSLYEGFGLTALEAMSVGTPVIAAQSPGLVEVCGSAARYFDARAPDSLIAAMTDVAGSPALRAELAALGVARAAEFSWDASARAHAEAYSLALNR